MKSENMPPTMAPLIKRKHLVLGLIQKIKYSKIKKIIYFNTHTDKSYFVK